MQSLGNEPGQETWPQIAPLLEEAMGKLGDKDRNALVLRFFEQKSLLEVGRAMGASEDAPRCASIARWRSCGSCSGARGVTLAAAAIAAALSANSVGAAPADLAARVSVPAASGVAASGSAVALVEATLKTLAWAKIKVAVAVGAAVLVVGGTVVVKTALVVRHSAARHPSGVHAASPVSAYGLSGEPGHLRTACGARALYDQCPHDLRCATRCGGAAARWKIVLGTTLSGFFVDEQSGVLGAYRRGAIRFNPDGVSRPQLLLPGGR